MKQDTPTITRTSARNGSAPPTGGVSSVFALAGEDKGRAKGAPRPRPKRWRGLTAPDRTMPKDQ